MVKNLKTNLKRRIIPILMAGVTGIATFSCSKKEDIDNINTSGNSSYTLEQNNIIPFMYDVTSYNAEEAKNKVYEMRKIQKSYEEKCTPIEFKEYVSDKEVTWDDLKLTIENTTFDEYHKNLLLRAIDNLKKHNFNMDLSVINYNLKNINVIYKDLNDNKVSKEFNCFNHTLTIEKDIKDDKHDIVFLHEVLGHGMTDAYIEDKKVYCSIDKPTFIIGENNKYSGYTLFGEAFTEAMAQIIAITALDKQLSTEYRSAYDLTMVELLMLCKDNNCELYEYANYGVEYLIDKIDKNGFEHSYDLIAQITSNLESSDFNEEPINTSGTLMYAYLCNSLEKDIEKGYTIEEMNRHMQELFNYYGEYILTFKNANNDEIVAYNKDFINLTVLYDDLGKYAYQNNNTYKLK